MAKKEAMAKVPPVTAVTDLLSGKKKESEKKKKKKHGFRQTITDHHDNGSHTVRHVAEDGGKDVSYAVADLDALHDGLEEHLGEPNEGEEAV